MGYMICCDYQAENMAYGCSGISTALLGPSLAEAPVIIGGNDEQKKKFAEMAKEDHGQMHGGPHHHKPAADKTPDKN